MNSAVPRQPSTNRETPPILTPALLNAKQSSAAELNVELDKMFNRWGFTTVFDIGSVLDNTLEIRRRIDNGELRGPRIPLHDDKD